MDTLTSVFVSYRTSDSAAHAGRLADALRTYMGSSEVFLSADDIEGGAEWQQQVLTTLHSSRVVLAVIGPNWASLPDGQGGRRLMRDDDVVRLEIRESLNRGIPVVPVLVGGATLPKSNELPADIAGLLARQLMEIRDSHWRADMDLLVDSLRTTAPGLRIRGRAGILASARRTTLLFLSLLVAVPAAHWLLVRLDVLAAESLRLLPSVMVLISAILFIAHAVARRRNS